MFYLYHLIKFPENIFSYSVLLRTVTTASLTVQIFAFMFVFRNQGTKCI